MVLAIVSEIIYPLCVDLSQTKSHIYNDGGTWDTICKATA